MQTVTFENVKGYKLAGVVERPDNSCNGQFIVFVHGFTGNKDEKGLFIRAAEYFCNQGFSVFRFDMTGCGESEGSFEDVSILDQKKDFLSAIKYLKEREAIRNQDIFILGFSLGATIALLGYESILGTKGLSFWSPALFPERDMYPRYQSDEIKREIDLKGYFLKSGLKVGSRIINDLGSCNLVPLLDSIKSPTLLIHGEKDEKISPRSTEIGSALFNGFGKFISIPEANHSFRSPEWALQKAMKETCNFFKSV